MTGSVLPADRMANISRVSVVIANYNQAAFLGEAIDSALGLDWPDLEVVVVDDGSTDGSRSVISSYGSRVRAIYQANQTQRVARNVGFAASTGDAVIHLDADDVLEAGLVRKAAVRWGPGVSKVQVQMQRIDERGRAFGPPFPRLSSEPTPEQMRRWLVRTSAYPTPPGSGNVYARWFLDQIFPLDDICGPATDSYCLAAAPVLGDVVTVLEPLVRYRIHPSNTSNMLVGDDAFARAISRAMARHAYRLAITGDARSSAVLFRSRELLQFRTANYRIGRRPWTLEGDSRWRLHLDILTSVLAPGPETLWTRLAVAGWCLVTCAAPSPIALRLVRWRFDRERRRAGAASGSPNAWRPDQAPTENTSGEH